MLETSSEQSQQFGVGISGGLPNDCLRRFFLSPPDQWPPSVLLSALYSASNTKIRLMTFHFPIYDKELLFSPWNAGIVQKGPEIIFSSFVSTRSRNK